MSNKIGINVFVSVAPSDHINSNNSKCNHLLFLNFFIEQNFLFRHFVEKLVDSCLDILMRKMISEREKKITRWDDFPETVLFF